mmetsp:Transcript_14413/g.38210  ORF Transcript_14413/g.38210 Transcript_14413/m.38210 type:complete len:210 (-) Transcript_14413:288-917(-)
MASKYCSASSSASRTSMDRTRALSRFAASSSLRPAFLRMVYAFLSSLPVMDSRSARYPSAFPSSANFAASSSLSCSVATASSCMNTGAFDVCSSCSVGMSANAAKPAIAAAPSSIRLLTVCFASSLIPGDPVMFSLGPFPVIHPSSRSPSLSRSLSTSPPVNVSFLLNPSVSRCPTPSILLAGFAGFDDGAPDGGVTSSSSSAAGFPPI